jgi:hypothetical protein
MKKSNLFKMICLMVSLATIFSVSVFAVDEAAAHEHGNECVHDGGTSEMFNIQSISLFSIFGEEAEVMKAAAGECSHIHPMKKVYLVDHYSKYNGGGYLEYCIVKQQTRCSCGWQSSIVTGYNYSSSHSSMCDPSNYG